MNKIKLIIILSLSVGFASDLSKIEEFLNAGEYVQGFNLIESLVTQDSENVSIFILGAKLAMHLDNLDKANEYYNSAIELDPKNDEYRSLWNTLNEYRTALKNAKKTYDSGHVDESIGEYQKVISNYPSYALAHYTLGLIYKQMENYDLAVESYQRANAINPFGEKYSNAIKAISQTMTQNGDTEYRRKEYYTAIEFYQQAVKYLPNYTEAIFRLAKTLYRIGDYENSRIHLERNIQLDGSHYQALKMMGDVYKKQGDRDGSIEWYKKAIVTNSNYDRAYYSLGSAFLSKGDLDGALEALHQAVLSNPEYSKAYETLGVVYIQLNNNELALENFIQATDLDNKAYIAFYRLSSVYNILTKYEEAKSSAKSCIKIKSNYAAAHFELGVAEKALGNKVAALASFEKATKDKNWRKSAKYEIDMINRGL